MFTGIVQHIGTVIGTGPSASGRTLRLDVGPLVDGLAEGDSVAVNGACLTARDIRDSQASFDAVAESLSRTTLGGLRPGAKVHLERALAITGRLDGHLVQGHVDGLASVAAVKRSPGWAMEMTCDRELTDQMVPKGSVALEGVSLTLVNVADGRFSVALIPTTLDETLLGTKRPGDRLNVETDVIGKYVLRYLQRTAASPGQGVDMDLLRRTGFA